jgi:hypothetical protein
LLGGDVVVANAFYKSRFPCHIIQNKGYTFR